MNDRELLELSAKAAGFVRFDWLAGDRWMNVYHKDGKHEYWNPLECDGDAFMLLVATKPRVIEFLGGCVDVDDAREMLDGANDATSFRRAIVRAAAEIGRNMK